jgi:hypothetical protein
VGFAVDLFASAFSVPSRERIHTHPPSSESDLDFLDCTEVSQDPRDGLGKSLASQNRQRAASCSECLRRIRQIHNKYSEYSKHSKLVAFCPNSQNPSKLGVLNIGQLTTTPTCLVSGNFTTPRLSLIFRGDLLPAIQAPRRGRVVCGHLS